MPLNSYSVRGDATDADKKLIELVMGAHERTSSRRWIFERDWFGNILYYIGQQWITYQDTNRRWRRKNLPSWVPMPVTNRLASTANTIRSAVAQIIPTFTAVPSQETEKSVLSAQAADKYLDVIMRESGFRGMRRRLASWVTLTGNGFIDTEFDTSLDTGLISIPGETCQECGNQIRPNEITKDLSCPNCGSQNLIENPDLSIQVPQGRIRVHARSPFEIYVNDSIQELDDQPEVLVVETVSRDSLRQTYGDIVNEVAPDSERDTSQHYLTMLSNATATSLGAGIRGRGIEQSDEDAGYGDVTLYKLYVKSCKSYPNGIRVIMTGDQHVLEAKDPYPFRHLRTNRPYYPLIHVRYDDVPGRFWAKTPIDDLVPKQRQRNEIESLYQTILMRTANPVWLLPSGIQSTPLSGDPAIVVRYTPMGGQKPERIPGLDAPPTVIKMLEIIDNDFEEIANTFAVMKGKNPGSVRAASAIQMLLERSFGRYGSVFDNLEEAYEQWAVQALEMWRQKAVFPRVQAVVQAAGSYQFTEFLGSDMGEVDIRVEAGSTRPKSQAGRQMLAQQALTWGLVNPMDPEQKLKLAEELGMTHLILGAEADVRVVAEENMAFASWAAEVVGKLREEEADGTVPPEAIVSLLLSTFPLKGNPVLDHHPTHVVHHRRFALSEQFRDLPEPIQQLFVQHILVAHYPYMLQEAATGLGPTGVMSGILAAQAGRAGQNQPRPGTTAKQGNGPGGEDQPFGSGGSNSPGQLSNQGTG